MARTCTICRHCERAEIDKALMAGASYRHIAAQYGVTPSALVRHRADHLPDDVLKASEARAVIASIDLSAELAETLAFAKKLRDACDRWLADPDDPSRYDVGLRSEDVDVIYEEREPGAADDKGPRVRKRAKLSRLLARLENPTLTVERGEGKAYDPRKLVLEALDRCRASLELIGELQGELARRPVVNVSMAPEWLALRAAISAALKPYPEARVAVAAALARTEADARGAVH